MNSHDNSDFVAIFPEKGRAHASDDGQPGFERENLRGLTMAEVDSGASELNCSSGQHESPDHTLVYNGLYPSCRDLTRIACGSWDDIHSSTPNQKSKPVHLKNLSTISIDQSITEYTPSCLSHGVVEWTPSPSDCDAGLCIRLTRTTSPLGIDNSSEIHLPNDFLTGDVSTGSSSTYTSVVTLGRGVHGKVFAARLKDDLNDKIYTLKTIPKASLVRRRVAAVSQELWILRFIADASLSNKPFPFLQKLKDDFQDEKNLFIVLEYFPTTLAHAETATSFRLSQKTTSPGRPSPSKTCQSEPEAVQALRFLAAELTLGLLFLQRHGIVHQNIKPANIFISEGGHAVIGEFGAASALPVSSRPGGNPFERPYPPSCIDQDSRTFGSIVLQPEDTVTCTPLYAAPELLERKENGILIYDERADWWSLGVSLYELTTGGIPFHISSDAVSIGKGRRDDENSLLFDLLEELDLTYVAHLDDYLRSLLVHDPSHRLSGERAKSHPFLEPLQNIWEDIEDLRHPPCLKPSARAVYGETDMTSDPQEDPSAFDAQCTQISCSRRLLESPQSTLDEEYYTPPELLSEQNSLESPFLIRRMEALAVKRPGSLNPLDSNALQESETSIILHEEAFMSYYIESSFQTNRSLSIGKPHPSTASVGRFLSNERSYGICSMQRQGATKEENFDEGAETSFTDSGLGFSPESWRHRRKTDSLRKPLAMTNEISAKPKMADIPEPDWTFDEKITISLLQASLKKQEKSEPTVSSRLSRSQSVAAISERIIKAARRRIAETLRRR